MPTGSRPVEMHANTQPSLLGDKQLSGPLSALHIRGLFPIRAPWWMTSHDMVRRGNIESPEVLWCVSKAGVKPDSRNWLQVTAATALPARSDVLLGTRGMIRVTQLQKDTLRGGGWTPSWRMYVSQGKDFGLKADGAITYLLPCRKSDD